MKSLKQFTEFNECERPTERAGGRKCVSSSFEGENAYLVREDIPLLHFKGNWEIKSGTRVEILCEVWSFNKIRIEFYYSQMSSLSKDTINIFFALKFILATIDY